MNPDGTQQTRLTTGALVRNSLAWSPDGTRLTYVSENGSSGKLYVLKADGSEKIFLADLVEPLVAQTAWSPDGTQLIFASRSGDDNNFQIFKINADGSGLIQLTSTGGLEPVWSPDGTQIVFCFFRRGERGISIMNADGSGQRNVTALRTGDIYYSPSWSPDGQKIFSIVDHDGHGEIYEMNLDGSSQKRLTDNFRIVERPQWSPNGAYLAFLSGVDGNALYLMNADGSDLKQVTHALGGYMDFTWAPDSQSLAFSALLYSRHSDDNFEIYTININGFGLTNLTNNSAADFRPVWQP